MPYNGSGTFSIVNTFVPNTTILSAAVNQNFTDIATGLSTALTRDGQAGMTAVFKAISGSVSAPGISFNSDATSGLYLASSGILGIVSHSLGMLLNTTLFAATSATVQAGGSGYAVGDVLYVSGGTSVIPAAITVATLSGSAVSTVSVAYSGWYSVKPTNAASTTSNGVGTGCTLNVTYNDPTSNDYRALFTNESGGVPWTRLGASSFVSGLMAKANGLDFATGIGSAALAQVIGGTFLLPPQGMLSPTVSPATLSDQTSVTRVYWTPYNGNVCPIYNGTSFVPTTSTQIFADTASGSQVIGGIYDVYKFIDSGTVRLGFGPSWLAGSGGSVTAGSCVRGTGAGGSQISLLNGILVNTVAMTVNNSSTTYSVAANQGTYLGSVYINAVAGQYNCHRSYGQTRLWGLYSHYNRQPIKLLVGDGNAAWTNNSGSVRPSNNNSANNCTVFMGFQDQEYDVNYLQYLLISPNGASAAHVTMKMGIGLNSTSAFSGTQGTLGMGLAASSINMSTSATVGATLIGTPSLGINVITALELGNASASVSVQFNGTQANQCMTTSWMG